MTELLPEHEVIVFRPYGMFVVLWAVDSSDGGLKDGLPILRVFTQPLQRQWRRHTRMRAQDVKGQLDQVHFYTVDGVRYAIGACFPHKRDSRKDQTARGYWKDVEMELQDYKRKMQLGSYRTRN